MDTQDCSLIIRGGSFGKLSEVFKLNKISVVENESHDSLYYERVHYTFFYEKNYNARDLRGRVIFRFREASSGWWERFFLRFICLEAAHENPA